MKELTNTCKAKGVDSKAVRAWAKAQGYPIGDKGRIHAQIIENYLWDIQPKDEFGEQIARAPHNNHV